MGGTDRRQVKLVFLDLVNELYTSECGGGVREALKSTHRSHSLFDTLVVLFDHIIEIAVRPHTEC
jgi:hypothetical protein